MHIHSMLSNGTTNIDSITNFRAYITRAKECGMNAMCFTEHGNIFEWIHKKEEIEKAGMKYIHGVEAYITETLDEKIRDNYHCVLIARNYDGVLELNSLVSNSYNRKDGHFYYMPRITYEELKNTSSNIIISTACLGGILHKGNENIKNNFIQFLKINKGRCFLEIQHHSDSMQDQKKYNQYLYNLSNDIGVPLISGTDTHALNDIHMEGRCVLQKAKGVRFSDEESWDLTFKTYDELVDAYKKQDSIPMRAVLDAIENTNKLADMVEAFEIDRSYKYPHLWEDSMKTFQSKIMEGIKRRGVDKYPNYQEYLDRIKYELKAYTHNQAIDFMLLMEDIIDWCIRNEIEIGYGRGSVNGSVIAWLLGITEMDSIKHNLNFDRFMNVERVSLSDIDTDFPPSRIEDVKQYIFSKTGLYCCDIVTFNTIAMKGAVRDIVRALYPPRQMPKDLKEKVDKAVEGYGNAYAWSKEIDEFESGQDYIKITNYICDNVEKDENKMRAEYPNVFKYVDLVIGTIVSVGSHPCGCVVAPFTVNDRIGTFTTSTSNYPISQINMKEIDGLNYVKLDLLRLDTIELINNTCRLIGIDRLTPDNVDITDIKVWNSIRDNTTQIFQWEGNTGDNYIKKLLSDENIKKFQLVNKNVDRMTLLSIGNSAIRPAGASYRDDLANGVVRTTGSKPIDDFLLNTFGYLVFQEQIIAFLHQYCGFTMGEADVVRRGFAKKTGTDKYIPIIKDGGYLTDKSNHYIAGFVSTMKEKYGIEKSKSEEDILSFIKVIEDASSYLFSLNHSQPYSYEGYVSGWLRYYYPLEFLTVALNINRDKEEKTQALTNYAKSIGIEIKPPKFGHSKAEYFCDKDSSCIYKGIGSIKYLNNAVADELFNLRNNTYNIFMDLLFDIKEISINSRQLDILIKLNFFSEFGGINYLLRCVELFDFLYGKKTIKKDKLESIGVSCDLIRPYCEKETDTRVDDIDCVAYVKSIGKTEDDLCDCVKYKKVNGEKIVSGYNTKLVVKKFKISDADQIKFATKIVTGQFSGIKSEDLLRFLSSKIKNEPTKTRDLIGYSMEYLGYVDVVDKKYKGFCVVMDLDVDYSPKLNLYALANGNTIQVKIEKRIFKNQPLKRGDIIKVIDQYRQKKMRANGKDVKGKTIFVETDDYEWWVTDYKIV